MHTSLPNSGRRSGPFAGPKFGSDAGNLMILVRALYGLKSSSAAFRAFLADTLYDLGYTRSKSDPDVWLRPAVKTDGFEYYEMIRCYVDDVLSISHDAMKTMKGIQHKFKLKDDRTPVWIRCGEAHEHSTHFVWS